MDVVILVLHIKSLKNRDREEKNSSEINKNPFFQKQYYIEQSEKIIDRPLSYSCITDENILSTKNEKKIYLLIGE